MTVQSPTAPTATTAARLSRAARIGIVAGVAVAASVVNGAIAQIALALGADSSFMPLQPAAYVSLTVVGVLLALAGWTLVRRYSSRPARLLGVLVPAVLLVSFVPDLTTAPQMPGASTLGVIALVLMHITTTVIIVLGFTRTHPVR